MRLATYLAFPGLPLLRYIVILSDKCSSREIPFFLGTFLENTRYCFRSCSQELRLSVDELSQCCDILILALVTDPLLVLCQKIPVELSLKCDQHL